jgi:hypothetical protein
MDIEYISIKIIGTLSIIFITGLLLVYYCTGTGTGTLAAGSFILI